MRRQTGMDHDFGMLDQALMMGSVARPLPAYSDVRTRCVPQPEKALAPEARLGCRNILTRMSEGDTVYERAIALDTMIQLAVDDPDASAWRQRYREFRWGYEQFKDSEIHRSLRPEDYWIDEVGSIQTALKASGRWPPPAGWLPDDDRARSLIQTGRPPPPKPR